MRIAIIGVGAVDGYLGAQLAAHGEDVIFVARGPQLDAMRGNGLRVKSDYAPAYIHPINVTDAIEKIGPVDLALLGVKLWDTDGVGRRLSEHLSPGTTVLSFQNGVRKDEILREVLPARALIGGVCYISASVESPGTVRHEGSVARVILGEFDGRRTDRTMRIFECFTKAGIDTQLSTSISEAIWEKFVLMVGLSSVTTATRQPVGTVRRRERTRQLLRDAMAEVVRVGRARGIRLPATFADEQMELIDTLPELMSSSMLTDLLRDARLELPWLGQSVTEMAEPMGVPTPVNDLLVAVLDPYVAGAPEQRNTGGERVTHQVGSSHPGRVGGSRTT